MNDDEGDVRADGGDGGQGQSTWLKGQPEPKDLTSRRGITEDGWIWLGQDSGPAPEQRRFGRSLAKAGLVVSAAAFLGGLVLLAITVGNGGDAQVVALSPPSSIPAAATVPASPLAAATVSASPATATVSASPLATTSAGGFGLSGWSW